MTPTKLQNIADRMRRAVLAHDPAWTAAALPGGLDMVLSRADDSWRLALRREQVPPSQTEIVILREVFGVPDDTEVRSSTKSEPHPVTKRIMRWQIVEILWREVPAPDDRPARGRTDMRDNTVAKRM